MLPIPAHSETGNRFCPKRRFAIGKGQKAGPVPNTVIMTHFYKITLLPVASKTPVTVSVFAMHGYVIPLCPICLPEGIHRNRYAEDSLSG